LVIEETHSYGECPEAIYLKYQVKNSRKDKPEALYLKYQVKNSRQWVVKTQKPVLNCLANNFQNDYLLFLAKHGNQDRNGYFATSRLYTKCKGVGERC
jgi:hypothetical protein